MSDARDTNHDGKVSLMEKVKDKLHLGHKDKDMHTTHQTATTAHTTPIVGTVPVASAPLAMPLAGATGARDLNRDGHISTAERLATGSHQSTGFNSGAMDLNRDGHISTAERLASGSHQSTGLNSGAMDLNRDGHISTAERLASGSHQSAGFADSRDLNRDGHISTAERLASGSHHSAGFADSRDLNRDGHISTAERLAAGSGFHNEEAHLRLHEEQLAISKREVAAGEVDIHKRVQQETVQQTIPVRREEVTVERIPLHGAAEPGARIAAQDEIVRVPLFREEVITEKRIVPTEEVIVRKKEVVDQQTVGATLRSEYVETQQVGMSTGFNAHAAGFDARDTNRDGHVSLGEKLQAGSAMGATNMGASHMGATNMGASHMGASNMGAFDARDTNRDGFVSTKEKLDKNRDGHVSLGEKLKGADLNDDGRVTMGERIKAARG